MDCRDLEKHIWAVAESSVPPDKKAAVEEHLGRCDDCRLLAAELATLLQETQEVNEFQVSPYFFTRLAGRIEAYEAGRGETVSHFLLRKPRWKSLVVAASLILGVGAGVHLGDAVTARQLADPHHAESEEFLFLAALDDVPHGSLAETLLDHRDGEEELR